MSKLWKSLGGIGLLLVLLFSGIIGKIVGKASVDQYYSGKNDSTLDEVLIKTADTLNKRLPMMVDSETRLDSTVGLSKSFRYNYTLINMPSSTVTAEQIDSALHKKLVNNVCTSKEMKIFVQHGVTVSYAYFGSDGKQIAVISIAPSECT